MLNPVKCRGHGIELKVSITGGKLVNVWAEYFRGRKIIAIVRMSDRKRNKDLFCIGVLAIEALNYNTKVMSSLFTWLSDSKKVPQRFKPINIIYNSPIRTSSVCFAEQKIRRRKGGNCGFSRGRTIWGSTVSQHASCHQTQFPPFKCFQAAAHIYHWPACLQFY